MIAFQFGSMRFGAAIKSLIASLCIILVGLASFNVRGAATPTAEDYQVVYDNTTTYMDWAFTGQSEYGDEVTLAGEARKVTEFIFEYYGDFTAAGDEYGQIRFYKNDGFPWPPASRMPGTLIYASPLFRLDSGPQAKILRDIDVVVPNTFTWSFQSFGTQGVPGDRVSSMIYDPPTIGKSFKDIWIKQRDDTWKLVIDPQKRRMSFSARVIAEHDSGAIVSRSVAGDQLKLMVKTKMWRKYQLQSSIHAQLNQWTNLGEPLVADSGHIEFARPADENLMAFRVVELPGFPEPPPARISSVTATPRGKEVVADVLEGFTYALEFRDGETNSWQTAGSPSTAIGTTLTLNDPSLDAPTTRQYRFAQVNKLEDFPSPEALHRPLFNGVVEVQATNVVDGQYYLVEYSTNLIGNEWKRIGAPIRSVEGKVVVTDKPINNLQRQYRVRHIHAPTMGQFINEDQRVIVVATALLDQKYALEYTQTLTNQTWFRTGAPVISDGPAVVLRDNGISRSRRFYRVVPVTPL